MKSTPFKTCPNCGFVWESLDAFLSDPELRTAGYQVAYQNLDEGLFFFVHLRENCGTTLAIPVAAFTGLSKRPVLSERGEQPECCPGLCLRKDSLAPCPTECECNWVRDVLDTIARWKKRAA